MSKFASITSSLLARKGEAAPWTGNAKAPHPWHMEPPPSALHAAPPGPRLAPATPPPHAPDDVRRCTVRLSQRDFERLGIMAVKKDVTRQQFLQTALARVLDEIAQEFPRNCACIGEGCGGCGKP